MSSVLSFLMIFALSGTAAPKPKPRDCKRLSSQTRQKSHAVATPERLSDAEKLMKTKLALARKKIEKAGYSEEMAERIVYNEETIAPYLIKKDTDLALPKKTKIEERGRGWGRELDLKTLDRKKSLKLVTVYRGVPIQKLADMEWDGEFFMKDSQNVTGNVIFVSKEYGEAESYAVQHDGESGFVLKLRVPEFMLFMLDDAEGFLHPQHIQNLGSFTEGVYIVKDDGPVLGHMFFDEEDYRAGAMRAAEIKKKWIPYSEFPKNVQNKIESD